MPGRFSNPLASVVSNAPQHSNLRELRTPSPQNFSRPYSPTSTSVPLAAPGPFRNGRDPSPTTRRSSVISNASSNTHNHRSPHPAKTLRDLNGTWTLSDAISSSNSTKTLPQQLVIAHSNYPSSLFIKEFTSDGHKQTQRYFPPQKKSEWSCWFDGTRSRWVFGREVEDRAGSSWLTEGLAESAEYLEIECENEKEGWRAVEIWGVDGGKLVKRIVKFNGVLEEVRLVYEVGG